MYRETPATAPGGVPLSPAPVPTGIPAGAVIQQVPQQPAPAALPKRRWNRLGFLSLVPGLFSWGILTVIPAILAILIGIVSLVWFRKETGRVGISAVIGIIPGIAALAALVLPA
jgi:hypothetical protein